jgi:hypothetical protein
LSLGLGLGLQRSSRRAIARPLALSGSPYTAGVVGTPFGGQVLQPSGGKSPYVFSLAPSSAALPAGATGIEPATGLPLGSPTTPGATTGLIIRVTDANGDHVDTDPFSITVYQSGSDTTPRVIDTLAFTGDVWYAQLSSFLWTDTVTAAVHGEPSTTVVFDGNIAGNQPGWIHTTFATPGTKVILVTKGGVTTATQISVVNTPAAPAASQFLNAATRVKAFMDAAVDPTVLVTPPTITVGAVNAATSISPSQTIAAASMPAGFTPKITGSPANNILANLKTGAKKGSQGQTWAFKSDARYVEIRVGLNSGGAYGQVNWRWLVSDDPLGAPGSWRWLTKYDEGLTTGSGARRVKYDRGSAATRLYCLIGSEGFTATELVVEAGATVSPIGIDQLQILATLDSNCFSENSLGYTHGVVSRIVQKLGSPLSGYNQGFPTASEGRYAGSVGTGTSLAARLGGNVYGFSELNQYGVTMDLIPHIGSVNDVTTDPTRLYWTHVHCLKKYRYFQPNALVLDIVEVAGPDGQYDSNRTASKTTAFAYAAGNDPGMLLIDSRAENWFPPGAIGSTTGFPAAGASVIGSCVDTTLTISSKTSGSIQLGMTLAAVQGIASITWSGAVATVTTTEAHGMTTGDTAGITISGATPGGYNGSFTGTATGANTLTYPLAANPGANTVPGSLTLPVAGINTFVRLLDQLSGSTGGPGDYLINLPLTHPAGTVFTLVGNPPHLNNDGAENVATRVVAKVPAFCAGIIAAAGGGGGPPAGSLLAGDGSQLLAGDGSYLKENA